ncbi:hypothetical protein CRG98_036532 [Punica granatum]|uniref:Uncharacterized protein n=1 Tax=Punica granatum TaxID=22663 RepID=A0A2I0IH09_PUNGR|nr:hypothetical protein CRG98_036532 [Punica granatum]
MEGSGCPTLATTAPMKLPARPEVTDDLVWVVMVGVWQPPSRKSSSLSSFKEREREREKRHSSGPTSASTVLIEVVREKEREIVGWWGLNASHHRLRRGRQRPLGLPLNSSWVVVVDVGPLSPLSLVNAWCISIFS